MSAAAATREPSASRAAGGAALADLYLGAVRTLALAMVAVVAAGVVLAPDLLGAWLGAAVAERSAVALRLLLVGVLVNAVAHVPSAFVQALGRPDLTARFHLVELVIHVPLTLLLVQRWGVAGAAAAWTSRVLLDAVLVGGAAHRLLGVSTRALFGGRWLRVLGTLAAYLALLGALRTVGGTGGLALAAHAAAALVAAAAFGAAAWTLLLAPADRSALLAVVGGRRGG